MNVMTSVPVRADPAPFPAGPARFSTEEFWRMMDSGAFEDMWVELIDGGFERMPPPGRDHSRLQTAIVIRLSRLIAESRLFGDVAVDLGDDTIVASDAVVLRDEGGSGNVVNAAEVLLAIEVSVSTRDRDLGLKRQLYAAAGIPNYWVVDADREVTHVFDRPENGDYMGLALARFGEPLAVPGADGAVVVE